MSEAGRGYDPQPDDARVAAHVDGVINVLKHVGALAGEPARPAKQHYLEPGRTEVFAPCAGIFKPEHSAAAELAHTALGAASSQPAPRWPTRCGSVHHTRRHPTPPSLAAFGVLHLRTLSSAIQHYLALSNTIHEKNRPD